MAKKKYAAEPAAAGDLDPLIAGLVARLPGSGEPWALADRKLWLEVMEKNFQIVYHEPEPPPAP
jgi:hypothetical protein